jgi:hypothetical protein
MPRDIRYFIDPETDLPHIYNHDVSELEVEEVFQNAPLNASGRRSTAGNRTHFALGRTAAGRYLKVAYARDTEGLGIFVITAYDMRGNELVAFRRRLRRKHR